MKFELLTLKASLTTQKLFLTFPLKYRTFALVLVTRGQRSEASSYYSLFTVHYSLIMRQAKVLYKGALSGVVTQGDDGAFRFVYDPLWLADTKAPPISLAMPKQAEPYTSVGLFPVLFNLLPEGENRILLCRAFRLDQDDDFGLLLCIAKHDTIGAITVAEIKENE